MSVLRDLSTRWRQVLPPLALQEFTAVFGVQGGQQEALARLLDELDAAGAGVLANASGLHNLRWILFAPGAGGNDAKPHVCWALVLSVVFDGRLEDFLAEFAELAHRDLERVLAFCTGLHWQTRAELVACLRTHRVPAGFMFRDLGPVALPPSDAPASHPPESGAVEHTHPPNAYPADATLKEIKSALALHNEFAEFYANNPPNAWSPAVREEFLRRFGATGFPFPLSPLERQLPEEDRCARLVAEVVERWQVRAARHSSDQVLRRGVHARAHGLIEGTFTVEPIDPEYRVGLFSEVGRSFEVLLRPSDGSGSTEQEPKWDARGLAIGVSVPSEFRIEGDRPPKFLRRPLPAVVGAPVGGRQDFLLFNHPTFVVPDIMGLARLVSIAEIDDTLRKVFHFSRLLFGRGGAKQIWTLLRVLLNTLWHPLGVQYFSATPYLLGDDFIVQYSIEPKDVGRLRELSPGAEVGSLAEVLRSSLRRESLELIFSLHVLPVQGRWGQRTASDVVEDATIDWSQLGATKIHAATIRIPPQDPGSTERLKQAEVMQFNPWNALLEHRPVGSLNRARWTAYEASTAVRSGGPNRPPAQSGFGGGRGSMRGTVETW